MTKFPNEPNSCDFFESDLDEKTCKKFCKSKTIAVDTEAMGLIHGRDRLCLIQICDEDDNVACIRINPNQDSAPNLKYLLEEISVDKVFHYARFDVAALSNGLGINVNPIFCTKIASKIARTYSPRHGLKELVMELTGVELDKSSQSSDWGKTEELSIKQLSYASNDVRYLIEVKNKLIIMLKREGRFELVEKCFNCIPVISELDIRRFTQIFDH